MKDIDFGVDFVLKFQQITKSVFEGGNQLTL